MKGKNSSNGKKLDYLFILTTDIDGVARGRTLSMTGMAPKDYRKVSTNTDSSSIPGLDPVEKSDIKTVGDPTTFRIIPDYISDRIYNSFMTSVPYRVGLIFSNNFRASDSSPHPSDPRTIAKNYEGSIKNRRIAKGISGVNIPCGAVPEFYTLSIAPDNSFQFVEGLGSTEWFQGYFDLTPGRDATEIYRMDVLRALNDLGLHAFQGHHEVGSSQHEFTVDPDCMWKTADNVMIYKWVTKSVASIYNWYASFMPKVRDGLPGNGMHIHISVWDKNGKKNLMTPKSGKEHFSDFGKAFIAGVLYYAPAYALVAAPTVNSYKRLVPHQEAPTIAVWDTENRSAMVRRPGYVENDTIRFELRFPDTSANPYLVFPVVVEAGLKGVENRMSLDKPIGKNVYTLAELPDEELDRMKLRRLPATLGEAVNEAENDKDKIIECALGKDVFRKLIEIKKAEWASYRAWCEKNHKVPDTKEVTDWELKRFLYL